MKTTKRDNKPVRLAGNDYFNIASDGKDKRLNFHDFSMPLYWIRNLAAGTMLTFAGANIFAACNVKYRLDNGESVRSIENEAGSRYWASYYFLWTGTKAGELMKPLPVSFGYSRKK